MSNPTNARWDHGFLIAPGAYAHGIAQSVANSVPTARLRRVAHPTLSPLRRGTSPSKRRCLATATSLDISVQRLAPAAALPRKARCDTMGHMKKTTIRELHQHTGALVTQAAEGHVITVLKRGVPVAELRPVGSSTRPKGLIDREDFLRTFPNVKGDSGKFLEKDRS